MFQNFWLQLSQKLAYFAIFIAVLGIGFYFGFKVGLSNQPKTTNDNQINAEAKNTVNIKSLELAGVYFFALNTKDHICPENYSVKGVFSSDYGYYYTKENKNFTRIKADICFTDEIFARDKAGFIKKY